MDFHEWKLTWIIEAGRVPWLAHRLFMPDLAKKLQNALHFKNMILSRIDHFLHCKLMKEYAIEKQNTFI